MKQRVRLFTAALLVLTAASSGAAGISSENAWLIQVLDDENVGRRWSAVQLLGERRVTEAVEPLIELLRGDEEYSVRFSAAVSLLKIGDVRALPALKRAAQRDRSKTVRHIAAVAYHKLKEATELAVSSGAN